MRTFLLTSWLATLAHFSASEMALARVPCSSESGNFFSSASCSRSCSSHSSEYNTHKISQDCLRLLPVSTNLWPALTKWQVSRATQFRDSAWKQCWGSVWVKLRFLHYVVVHSFLHLIAPFCCIRPINALNSVNDRHTGRFDTEKWLRNGPFSPKVCFP